MEVHGIDLNRGAYRVSFQAEGRVIRGLVPETLVSAGATAGTRPGNRPGHQDVYQWIATHRRHIEHTLLSLAKGQPRRIRAPYDRLTLEKED